MIHNAGIMLPNKRFSGVATGHKACALCPLTIEGLEKKLVKREAYLLTIFHVLTDELCSKLMEMAPWSLTISPKAVQEVQESAQKSRKRSRT